MQNNLMQTMLFDFYSELNKISLPEDIISYALPSAEALSAGHEKAIPLLSLCPPMVKPDDFFSVLKQTAVIIKNYHPDLAEEIMQIEAALPVEPTEQETFVSKVFVPGTNLLEELKQDVSPETFGFLLNHAVKPIMIEYGKATASFYDLEQWHKGICPVCGGRPTLSLLEKDEGKRYLYCGMCEVKWRFQRMGCPYCSNGDSQFFTVEGMDKYRVYFCEKCNGYIKTVDGRRAAGEEVNLFWEDINTLQLDLLAIHEGYFNKQADLPLKDLEK